jgi:hypothetical protein
LSSILPSCAPVRADSGLAIDRKAGPAAEMAGLCLENQLTKPQTTHCFPAISDYIAAQRVGCARSFWPGFLFGRETRLSHSRFLSVIRKSGSRFSGEIVLQPLSDAEEET